MKGFALELTVSGGDVLSLKLVDGPISKLFSGLSVLSDKLCHCL